MLRAILIVYLALFGAFAWAADHQDAPTARGASGADLGDLFVFRSPSRPSHIVFAMTVVSFDEKSLFSPDILYRFALSNAGGPRPEINIDFTFSPAENGATRFSAYTPAGTLRGEITGSGGVIHRNDVAVFAGLVDDPHFFDPTGGDADAFAGRNALALVVEAPVELLLAKDHGPLLHFTGLSLTEARSEAQAALGAPTRRRGGRVYSQADRVGAPGVSTLLAPAHMRDALNFAPMRDGADQLGGADLSAELALLIDALNTRRASKATLKRLVTPNALRVDLRQPMRFPNGRAPADDVADIMLAYILGKRKNADGVARNDRPFRPFFPYFAPPHQSVPRSR